MTRERNKAVPAVYLFLKKGEEVLLMRRKNSGYYDGWYSLSAGHVEAGELPLGGLVREVGEELGIGIDPGDAKLVHTMYRTRHDETGDRFDLFFLVETWSGEIRNMEPDKCDDIRWFPIDALPENTVHHVRDAILHAERGADYSEIDLEHTPPNPSS